MVLVKVYDTWLKGTETPVRGKFVAIHSCIIIGKLCMRQTCSAAVLSIVAVDAKVLLQCLDSLFIESTSLQVIGGGKV